MFLPKSGSTVQNRALWVETVELCFEHRFRSPDLRSDTGGSWKFMTSRPTEIIRDLHVNRDHRLGVCMQHWQPHTRSACSSYRCSQSFWDWSLQSRTGMMFLYVFFFNIINDVYDSDFICLHGFQKMRKEIGQFFPRLEGKITPDQFRQCWDMNTNCNLANSCVSLVPCGRDEVKGKTWHVVVMVVRVVI